MSDISLFRKQADEAVLRHVGPKTHGYGCRFLISQRKRQVVDIANIFRLTKVFPRRTCANIEPGSEIILRVAGRL
jgi:hypothetical protein